MKTYTKDPDTTERFRVDWADRLSADGATLSTVVWSAVPAGLTLSGATQIDPLATTLVAGGVLGVTYHLTCRATLSDGQMLDRTMALLIQPT